MLKRKGIKYLLILLQLSGVCSLVRAQQLYEYPAGVSSRVSSPENLNGVQGNGGKVNQGAKGRAFISLKAGASTDLLAIDGPGQVQRIWITLSERSDTILHALRLRMFWDHASKPAVDVPFGDFFCAGLKPVAFQSALFANPEGRSFICTVPMPFRKGARIVLTNEGEEELAMLFFDVDFIRTKATPASALYFHACWTRTRSAPVGNEAVYLPRVTGRGRFLGVSVALKTNPVYGHTWWGEGEFKCYLDGDGRYPTLVGTGSEDYLGTGWSSGKFTQLNQGCLVTDDNKGLYAFYRFHLPDAIYFEKECRVVMQQMGGSFRDEVVAMKTQGVPLRVVSAYGESTGFKELAGQHDDAELSDGKKDDWLCFYRSDDYRATAYFYLNKPVSKLPALPPLKDRL